MPQEDMQSTMGQALIDAGRTGIVKGDEELLDSYFQPDDYVFHGPDGDMDYDTLKAFFASLRASLEGYACERHDLIVKGDMIAARTRMSGRFTAPLKDARFGQIEPNGEQVTLEIINFFRYNEAGRLVEEWVQYDNLGWYRQLGVELEPRSTNSSVG